MKILEKLGNLFAAVAFAEEGDAETARRLAAEGEDGGDAPGARVRSARPAPRPGARREVPLTGRSRA